MHGKAWPPGVRHGYMHLGTLASVWARLTTRDMTIEHSSMAKRSDNACCRMTGIVHSGVELVRGDSRAGGYSPEMHSRSLPLSFFTHRIYSENVPRLVILVRLPALIEDYRQGT